MEKNGCCTLWLSNSSNESRALRTLNLRVARRNKMIAFETSFLAKKMPHLVVPARLFCTVGKNTHNFVDLSNQTGTNNNTQKKKPSSPTIQNTLSHSTHTSKSMMHTPNCSPPTSRYAQTLVTNVRTQKQTSGDRFCWRLSCVEHFVMTDGLAPKRQRFGNHDWCPCQSLMFPPHQRTQP